MLTCRFMALMSKLISRSLAGIMQIVYSVAYNVYRISCAKLQAIRLNGSAGERLSSAQFLKWGLSCCRMRAIKCKKGHFIELSTPTCRIRYDATSIWTNYRLWIHAAATWFSFQISNIALKKKSPKAKWDAIQTRLQIMKNDSLRSWPHDARAAQTHADRLTPAHSHTSTRICMYFYRTFANERSKWSDCWYRSASSVPRNPIKCQTDIKSFSPFRKDRFVCFLTEHLQHGTAA